MQPPVPYADFTFSFPMSDLPANLGSPAFPMQDLETSMFSSAESSQLFGFLDTMEWDFDPNLSNGVPIYASTPGSDMATPQLVSSSTSVDSASTIGSCHSPPQYPYDLSNNPPSPAKYAPEGPQYPSPQPASHSSASSASPPPSSSPPHHNHTTRTKPLLSTPQKRLNHIMSEQKRRNAIRDGYATLTNMLAPAGAPVGSGIPTRGRPKGSGTRGKKGSTGAKGKSGVLFRAVEYCKWLEEGCDALRLEVERVEFIAGIAPPLR